MASYVQDHRRACAAVPNAGIGLAVLQQIESNSNFPAFSVPAARSTCVTTTSAPHRIEEEAVLPANPAGMLAADSADSSRFISIGMHLPHNPSPASTASSQLPSPSTCPATPEPTPALLQQVLGSNMAGGMQHTHTVKSAPVSLPVVGLKTPIPSLNLPLNIGLPAQHYPPAPAVCPQPSTAHGVRLSTLPPAADSIAIEERVQVSAALPPTAALRHCISLPTSSILLAPRQALPSNTTSGLKGGRCNSWPAVSHSDSQSDSHEDGHVSTGLPEWISTAPRDVYPSHDFSDFLEILEVGRLLCTSCKLSISGLTGARCGYAPLQHSQ